MPKKSSSKLAKKSRPKKAARPAPPAKKAAMQKSPAKRKDFRMPAAKFKRLQELIALEQQEPKKSKLFGFYIDIVTSIRDELQDIDPVENQYEQLSPARRCVVLIDTLDAEICNGGFAQYYGNSSGDGATLVPAELRRIGQLKAARIVQRANAQFGDGPPRDQQKRDRAWSRVHSKAESAWSRANSQWYELPPGSWNNSMPWLLPYIIEHASEFFRLKEPNKR